MELFIAVTKKARNVNRVVLNGPSKNRIRYIVSQRDWHDIDLNAFWFADFTNRAVVSRVSTRLRQCLWRVIVCKVCFFLWEHETLLVISVEIQIHVWSQMLYKYARVVITSQISLLHHAVAVSYFHIDICCTTTISITDSGSVAAVFMNSDGRRLHNYATKPLETTLFAGRSHRQCVNFHLHTLVYGRCVINKHRERITGSFFALLEERNPERWTVCTNWMSQWIEFV